MKSTVSVELERGAAAQNLSCTGHDVGRGDPMRASKTIDYQRGGRREGAEAALWRVILWVWFGSLVGVHVLTGTAWAMFSGADPESFGYPLLGMFLSGLLATLSVVLMLLGHWSRGMPCPRKLHKWLLGVGILGVASPGTMFLMLRAVYLLW